MTVQEISVLLAGGPRAELQQRYDIYVTTAKSLDLVVKTFDQRLDI